uniref:Uncharacterized protein n=1 Tax=Megaviridae environmental sample TaxID=1737588 RepID=A0A5J6VHE4_9VIRU|nr:MAG: hypothetical protein [Megaviridae environmental sample]
MDRFIKQMFGAANVFTNDELDNINGQHPSNMRELEQEIALYLDVPINDEYVSMASKYLENLAAQNLWNSYEEKLRWMQQHIHCIQAQADAKQDNVDYIN